MNAPKSNCLTWIVIAVIFIVLLLAHIVFDIILFVKGGNRLKQLIAEIFAGKSGGETGDMQESQGQGTQAMPAMQAIPATQDPPSYITVSCFGNEPVINVPMKIGNGNKFISIENKSVVMSSVPVKLVYSNGHLYLANNKEIVLGREEDGKVLTEVFEEGKPSQQWRIFQGKICDVTGKKLLSFDDSRMLKMVPQNLAGSKECSWSFAVD